MDICVWFLPYPISPSVEMSSVVHLVPILPVSSHSCLLCISTLTVPLMPKQNTMQEVKLAHLETEA